MTAADRHAPVPEDGKTPAPDFIPAVRREKLLIDRIGLAGLILLWLPAIAVAAIVPMAIGVYVFRSLPLGIVGSAVLSLPVAARAVYRIRANLAQWRQRHRREDV